MWKRTRVNQEVMAEQPRPEMALIGQKARPANLASDVGVPLAQALITGTFAAAIAYLLDATHPTIWGLTVAAIVWLIQTFQVNRLLWAAERHFQLDINRDGYKGKPPLPDIILNNRAPRTVNPKTQKATIPPATTAHPFAQFVLGCAASGTDMRYWEDAGLSRMTQQKWRDQLIAGGWAEWCSYDTEGAPNVNQGWRLLADPEEILKNCSFT